MDAPSRSEGARAGQDGGRPVFLQDWWLQTACRDEPASVDIHAVDQGERIGTLRYIVHRNKIGSRLGGAPYWSHLGGPLLAPGLTEDRQRDAIRQLAGQLPKNISFSFVCDPTVDYADLVCEEFGRAGFDRSALPTYLHHPGDADILSGMKSRHRAQIRSAAKGMIIEDVPPDAFFRFYEENLPAPTHSPLRIAHALLAEGVARGQARALLALNCRGAAGSGCPDAAIACVWDDRRYYYWLSTRRRRQLEGQPVPNPEATKLLILAATEHAGTLGLTFDADSPETVGGRTLFEKLFGFRRIEHRNVLTRRTLLTGIYDRAAPMIKNVIKTVFPDARIHAPRKTN